MCPAWRPAGVWFAPTSMVRAGAIFPGLMSLALASCADPVDLGSDEQLAIACADGPTVKGMDVSYYEDSVDWDVAHAAGIDFAFIRATDGVQYIDPRFPAYWAGARAAGVIRGAYQFFRPAEDPIAQADLLLERMGPLEPGDLPPVIDVEVSGNLTPAEVAASVRAWVTHVTQKIGRVPIVYAGLYSWHDLTSSADLTTSPLWVAQYTTAPCPNIPVPWTRWMFWQYSSTGTMPGVSGTALDLNVFNGTLEDLRAFTAPGACGDGTCSADETSDTCALDCPPCGTIAADGGVIDDSDACFTGGGPAQYLRHVRDAGYDSHLIWTHATASATEANFGQWNLHFAAAGRYRVEAYTAHAYAGSTRATYLIDASGASTAVTIDQTAVDGWQSLGELDFAAGGGQSVHLGDNTGEASADNVQLVMDAVRLTRIPDATTPPPVPDPPPVVDPPPPARVATDAGGCAATGTAGGPGLLALLIVVRRRRGKSAG
jgi:GH25 family lysozyme M1 (1,4-beta-N-acetylmuramidase)